jgi:Flp pilus assembly protein TadG
MKSNKALFRKGFGFEQIVAFLLLVLPTLAFIIMLVIEYWSVMRIDNNLKLITIMLSNVAAEQKDVRDDDAYSSVIAKINNGYCPNGTSLQTLSKGDNGKGEISISVAYQFDGRFFSKKLVSKIDTFSYFDQNLTASYECQ